LAIGHGPDCIACLAPQLGLFISFIINLIMVVFAGNGLLRLKKAGFSVILGTN